MNSMEIIPAKILQGQKQINSNFWKYDFFNTQTGIKDNFYSNQKVKHIPNLAGRLKLATDEQQTKTLQWFSQDILKFQKDELVKFEEPLKEEIKKLEVKPKKIITKLAPWQISKLRAKGFSWLEIREFCNVSEW